jgi:hypothetical protein
MFPISHPPFTVWKIEALLTSKDNVLECIEKLVKENHELKTQLKADQTAERRTKRTPRSQLILTPFSPLPEKSSQDVEMKSEAK